MNATVNLVVSDDFSKGNCEYCPLATHQTVNQERANRGTEKHIIHHHCVLMKPKSSCPIEIRSE